MRHRQVQNGFTILELLVSVGVMGILASMVLVAINPQSQLTSAEDAKRLTNASTLESRTRDWQIGRQKVLVGLLPTWKPICALDTSCQGGVSFDEVYDDGYIKVMPVDPLADVGYTGYEARDIGGFVTVRATYYGVSLGSGPEYEARWEFEEGAGVTAADTRGNVDGTLSGGPTWTADYPDVTFTNQQSLLFDGASDTVEMGDNFDLGTDDMTITAWFKTSAASEPGQDMYIVSKSDMSYEGGRYAIGLTEGRISAIVDAGSSDSAHTGETSSILGLRGSMNNGMWRHVALVLDRDDEATLYVDGAVEGTLDITLGEGQSYDTVAPFRVGGYDDGGAVMLFNGLIDDVRVYRKALTMAEVANLVTMADYHVSSAPIADAEPVLWYDSQDLTLYTDTGCTSGASVGDSVACWQDKSGNAVHITQGTAAERPVLRADGVEFRQPWNAQQKDLANGAFTQSWMDFTISAYCKSYVENDGLLISQIANGSLTSDFSWNTRSTTQAGDFHTRIGGTQRHVDANTAMYDGDFHHIVWRFDATSDLTTIWIDGAVVNTTSETNEMSRTDTGLHIGGVDGSALNDLIGVCAEFQVFDVSIDDDEIVDLAAYHATKYAPSTPTITDFEPADNATAVELDSNLVITFSEAVQPVDGDILIKRASDNVTVQTIDVRSAQVTGGGTDTITINPTDLIGAASYYVQIEANAFDAVDGNSFDGIADTTTWSFTSWGPNNMGLSLVTWYDGADASSIFTDHTCATPASSGSAVGCWRDKSGNSYHMLQATGGNKPAYRKFLNGIKFASPSYMYPGTTYLFTARSPVEDQLVFVAYKHNTAPVGNQAIYGQLRNNVAASYGQGILYAAGGYILSQFRNASVGMRLYTIVADLTNTQVYTFRIKDSANYIRRNGTTIITNTETSPQAWYHGYVMGMGAGINVAPLDSYLDGDIYELIHVNGDITDQQRQEIESYLLAKWNLDGPTDYIARWNLDQGSGTTAVCSDVTHNATLVNMEAGDWSTTKPTLYDGNSYAFDLDGVDEYAASASYMTSLNGGSAFSIMGWLRADTLPFNEYEGFFARGLSALRTPWIYGNQTSNNISANFQTTTGGAYDGNMTIGPLVQGQWHHLAFTWDGSSFKGYIDGVLKATDPTTGSVMSSANGPVELGRINGFGEWDGALDDFRVYSRALNSGEIERLAGGY